MRVIYCGLILAIAMRMIEPAFAQQLETVPGKVEEVVSEPVQIPQGGLFGSVEIGIIRPRVKQYPSDLLGGLQLGTTVAPEFELGYQFAGGRSIHFDYRFLSSAGGSNTYYPQSHPIGLGPNDEIIDATRPYSGYATLKMQTFDLDFTFREPSWEFLPFVRSRWEIGARAVLLSTEVREPKVFDDRFGWSQDRASEWFGDEKLTSTYQGYGPHFDYKLAIAVDSWGLEFFALSDVAVLFGTRTARYSPVDAQPYRNGRMVGPGWDMNTGTAVLTDARPFSEHRFACTAWNWRGDIGAKLTRPWRGRMVTVAAGYRMDYWTLNGQSNGGGGFFGGIIKVPDLDLAIKGAFLRFEIKF